MSQEDDTTKTLQRRIGRTVHVGLVSFFAGAAVTMFISLMVTGKDKSEDWPDATVDLEKDADGDYKEVETEFHQHVDLMIPRTVENPEEFVSQAFEDAQNYRATKKKLDRADELLTQIKEQVESIEPELKEAQRLNENMAGRVDELGRLNSEAQKELSVLDAKLEERLLEIKKRVYGIQEMYIRSLQSIDQGPYMHQGITRSDIDRFFDAYPTGMIKAALKAMGEGTDVFLDSDYRIFVTVSSRDKTSPATYAEELKLVLDTGQFASFLCPKTFELGVQKLREHYQTMNSALDSALKKGDGKIRIQYTGRGSIFSDIYRSVYKKDPTRQQAEDMRRVVAEKVAPETIEAMKYELKPGKKVNIKLK